MKKFLNKLFKRKKEIVEAKSLPTLKYNTIKFGEDIVKYSVQGEYTHLLFPNEGRGLTTYSHVVKGISPRKYTIGMINGTHYGTILSTDVRDFVLALNNTES